jgi:hypothetical protein
VYVSYEQSFGVYATYHGDEVLSLPSLYLFH